MKIASVPFLLVIGLFTLASCGGSHTTTGCDPTAGNCTGGKDGGQGGGTGRGGAGGGGQGGGPGGQGGGAVDAGAQDAAPEAGASCGANRQLCGVECVDTSGDTRHCGGCGQACAANQVCASSACRMADDCRQTPCPGLSYCDLSNGQCKPGCALDTQCGTNESCDIATHACVCKSNFTRCGGPCVANNSGVLACGNVCATCPTAGATAFACSGTSCVATTCSSGNHLCSGSCLSNASVNSCGTSCSPCPTSPNGTATCNGTTCGLTCNSTYQLCGGVCAACPTAGATLFACSLTSCVATACMPTTAYRLCNGVCATCPTTNVTTTTCSGSSCVASACSSGYHICSGACVLSLSTASCGTSCTACAMPANGVATCNGTTCSATCNTGYRLCANVCALCPTPASTTACSGATCVAATCDTTRHVCSGQCVLKSSPATCGTLCTPCPAAPANAMASCDGTNCGFTCNNGWARCGSACCPDCRQMSGVCTGLDWCSDVSGLCGPVQKLQPDAANATNDDNFGYRVALAGTLAVVGSPSDDSSTGSVYTFERQSDGAWRMQGTKLRPNPVATVSNFGTVALSGQRMLVGANGESSARGAAYIFDRVGTSWIQQAKVLGQAASDNFGVAVALDGDRAIVGAQNADDSSFTNSGAAYIYERQGDGTWPTTGIKLLASNRASSTYFGSSVSISGDRALVGAFNRSAFVFARQADGSWIEEQILTPTGGTASDQFGAEVSISGDRALVGAIADNDLAPAAGAVYVFERQSNGTWMQTAKLHAPPPYAGGSDQFGWAVSQEGERVLVGAVTENRAVVAGGSLAMAGSAYLFQHNTDGTWTAGVELQSYAADVIANRQFGGDVALSGDYAIIGASSDLAGAPIAGVRSGTAYVANTRSVLP